MGRVEGVGGAKCTDGFAVAVVAVAIAAAAAAVDCVLLPSNDVAAICMERSSSASCSQLVRRPVYGTLYRLFWVACAAAVAAGVIVVLLFGAVAVVVVVVAVVVVVNGGV